MTNDRFHGLLGGPPRKPETEMDPRYMDVARSIQAVTEEVMVRLARHAVAHTGLHNLCMAGGVALNCVANGRILREGIVDQLWIQPAAGDAGGALGAALAVWHLDPQSPGRSSPRAPVAVAVSPESELPADRMHGSLLGPEFAPDAIETTLKGFEAVYHRLDDEPLIERVAELLTQGKVIGWFQGRMEFGPRALGNRSILGDARSTAMQSVMNLKVKFRESFRPFAPIVLKDRLEEYFQLTQESPYMLLVASIQPGLKKDHDASLQGLDLLKQERSTLPAITHVDDSARIQTVDASRNPLLHRLMTAFERRTDCGVLVNTSFNVRGEPIVCSPEDAYRCFVNTAMDYLVMGPFLMARDEQPTQPVETKYVPIPD